MKKQKNITNCSEEIRLPEAFVFRTKTLLRDEWDAFEHALKEESPTSIRLNPEKMQNACSGGFDTQSLAPVAWASDAYYLHTRPSFTLDPLFHAGCYYVQEASSMYLGEIIKRQVPEKVRALDLCAAPGGKSTQLISVLPEKSLLVANEILRSRSYILAENLIKWGNPNLLVTNNDAAAIGKLDSFFDVVLADLPCSGEGLFRKDPSSVNEWSVNNVQLCRDRQRRIVADVWPALAPGGLLIYSTCTYNREENEENIEWVCKELGATIVEEPRRFMPHKTKGEGFFIAALRKDSHSAMTEKQRGPIEKIYDERKKLSIKSLTGYSDWLSLPDDFVIYLEKNIFTAIPSVHFTDFIYLKKQMKIMVAGITLGEIKGKDMIPNHALAMSNSLASSAFPTWELDKETALQYLRKEALQAIPSELPKGYILVTYQSRSLGFIKNIGNRANNLYPQEWRIRMKTIRND